MQGVAHRAQRLEGMRLRIAHLEPNVGHAFAVRELAGAGDHPSIDVDAQRVTDESRPRDVAGCPAAPAADVQHTVCCPDAQRRTERSLWS